MSDDQRLGIQVGLGLAVGSITLLVLALRAGLAIMKWIDIRAKRVREDIAFTQELEQFGVATEQDDWRKR